MTNLYDIIPGVRYVQSKLNQIWSYIPPPPPRPSNNDNGQPYKILVVHAHPNSESSYSASIVKTFIEAATNVGGHHVRCITLYDHITDPTKCYRPNISRYEHENYFTLLQVLPTNNNTAAKLESTTTSTFQVASDVQTHIDDLLWCDTLVFIYPTWWMNTPASMKGFIDRTLLPGPTWDFPSSSSSNNGTRAASLLGLVPKLNNIQRIIGISTYGANNLTVFLAGDNGRRMISNAVRHSVCPNASIVWLGMYGIDTATLQQRQDFLKTVANLPSRKTF